MPDIVLDLHYVDELIAQRRIQHGGYQGAPPIVNGYREGESLNRSCILLLSALLQTYVEEVFEICSWSVLPGLADSIEQYRKGYSRWGNPSSDNINQLFMRLGAGQVLSGLKWQRTPEVRVAAKLRSLNELRNSIAHGKKILKVSGKAITLSLSQIENYRNFVSVFAYRFEDHAKKMVLLD